MRTPNKPRTAMLICMAILLYAGIYKAQGQPYYVYQKNFYETGNGTYQEGYELVQTTDGGYAIGGFYGGPPAGIGTFYLIKVGAMGEYQWTGDMWGEFCYAKSLRQTFDNGYIMAGYYGPYEAGSAVQVIKYTVSGTTDWRQQFQIFDTRSNILNQINAANCIRQTTDSGYILTGYTRANSASRSDLFLAKLNRYGNISWIKQWEDISYDDCIDPGLLTGQAVEQTSDGGFIIAGTEIEHFKASLSCIGSIPPGPNFATGMVIKTDGSGNEVWKKKLYFEEYTDASTGLNSVVQTSDGGYIVTGYTTRYEFGPGIPYREHKSVILVKLYSNGNTDWIKVYDTEYDEEGYCVKETADGDFIISGMNYNPGNIEDAMLLRVGPSGVIRWAKAYGRDPIWQFKEYGRSVVETFAGTTNTGFALAGLQRTYAVGSDTSKRVYLVKTTPAGNSSDCNMRDIDFDVINFEQNLFAELGSRTAGSETGDGYNAIESDTKQDTLCYAWVNFKQPSEEIGNYGAPERISYLHVYPNPVSGEYVDVRYELLHETEIRMVVTNALGENIYTYKAIRMAGAYEAHIDASSWTSGVYTLTFYADGNTINRKIVRVR